MISVGRGQATRELKSAGILQLGIREGHQILLGLKEGVAQDRMMSVETDAVLEKGTVLTMSIDTDILHLRTERTPEIKRRELLGTQSS